MCQLYYLVRMQRINPISFDFNIALPSPYKLCDFRPIYGKLFQQYINGADFWGFGDIDLIYGDIRQFITENVLQNYDLISGWGHLTLVRNNDYWNNFYKIKQKDVPIIQKFYQILKSRIR